MSAPREAVESSERQRLGHYHARLPALARILDRAGFTIGPDRWQNVYDLLLALSSERRLPTDPTELSPWLAPLLTTSSIEQDRFEHLFRQWAEAPEQQDAVRTTSGHFSGPFKRTRSGIRMIGWSAAALILLVAIAVGVSVMTEIPPDPPNGGETPPEQAPPDSTLPEQPETVGSKTPDLPESVRDRPEVPAATPGPSPESPTTDASPPRYPLPPIDLDRAHRSAFEYLELGLILLPPMLMLGWIIAGWLVWKTVLTRRKGKADEPVSAITLDTRLDDLLGQPPLLHALRQLHAPNPKITPRIHVDTSVHATVRRGGLIELVWRRRNLVPECVVLAERRHGGDQMGGLAEDVAERLEQAGLILHRFHYRVDPTRLQSRDGQWWRLGQVVDHYPDARMIIIGEPASLIDPFTGRLASWTADLAPWSSRGLLTTRRPPRAWREAIEAGGFEVAEIGSRGLQDMALALGRATGTAPVPLPELTSPLPVLLQDADRWTRPIAPRSDQLAKLWLALDGYLDPSHRTESPGKGTLLLAGMAAYPQLSWSLTRALDRALFPQDTATERERRLLRIIRLPWCRIGWMPAWLRRALQRRANRSQRRRIRGIFRDLMQGRVETDPTFRAQPAQRVRLPVVLPEASDGERRVETWRRMVGSRFSAWWKGLRQPMPPHSALEDRIFAQVLLGWRVRLLDFGLPRSLLGTWMLGSLQVALRARMGLALLIAVLGSWGVSAIWDPWLAEPCEQLLLERQRDEHSQWHVQIHHHSQTEELAYALHDTLKRDGFEATIAGEELSLVANAGLVNLVHHRSARAHGSHVERYLKYLTWGADVEVSTHPRSLAAEHLQEMAARELGVYLFQTGKRPRRALLIGVHDYSPTSGFNRLNGPINDIRLMHGVLTKSFGLPPEAIRVLVDGGKAPEDIAEALGGIDGPATHCRIRNAFESLRDELVEGSLLYVHFSGHGSQVSNVMDGSTELEERDQTWVTWGARRDDAPTDYCPPDAPDLNGHDILDDELSSWLAELNRKGIEVVLVSDSGHSATVARDSATGIRTAPIDSRSHPAYVSSYMPSHLVKTVRIGAAGDREGSQEDVFDGMNYGIFTWFWAGALASATDKTTWEDAFKRAAAQVRDRTFGTQRPEIAGEGKEIVIRTGKRLNTTSALAAAKVDGDIVELRGGLLVGVTEGSVYRRARDTDLSTALRLEIVQTAAFESKARMVSGSATGNAAASVQVGDLFVVETHVFRMKPIKLWVSADPVAERLDQDLTAELKASLSSLEGFQLVDRREDRDLEVYVLRYRKSPDGSYEHDTVNDSATLPLPAEDGTTEVWILNKGQHLVHEGLRISGESIPAAIEAVRDNLTTFAMRRQILGLSEFSATLSDPVVLRIRAFEPLPGGPSTPENCDLGRHEQDYRSKRWDILADGSSPFFDAELSQDACLRFEVVNESKESPVYSYLFNVTPDARIQYVFPYPADPEQYARIAPSTTRDYAHPDNYGVWFRADQPGTDYLMFLVADEPIDIGLLTLDGYRTTRVEDGLIRALAHLQPDGGQARSGRKSLRDALANRPIDSPYIRTSSAGRQIPDRWSATQIRLDVTPRLE